MPCLLLLAALPLFAQSAPKDPGPRSYAELAGDVVNPERGMIVFTKLHLDRERDLSYLRGKGVSLVYCGVPLGAFRGGPLDADFLAQLGQGFDGLRRAGLKTVLRFTYSGSVGDADAPKEIILKHIAQLKPVLQANADVIAVLQAGFIGAWGEWHASSNGLDADGPRREILTALLAAAPASRFVQLRTPMFKQRLLGKAPLAEAEAFRDQPRARVGHHNDAFLSDENDHGTFDRPVQTWKDWMAQDTRFAPFGAETFDTGLPEAGVFMAELARYHTSFLHLRYPKPALQPWEAAGHLETIRRRLGYRLVLSEASWTPAVRPGGDLKVAFTLRNAGFAAPFNRRPLRVVLSNDRTRQVATLKSVDVRRWEPGAPIRVSVKLTVPASTPAGKYRLSLWLPDEAPSIEARPEYAIRFANDGIWDASTGENVLGEGLRLDPFAPGVANSRVKEFAEAP
jgi:hypothetical protein